MFIYAADRLSNIYIIVKMEVNLHSSCKGRRTLVWDSVTTAGQMAFVASRILRLPIGQRLLKQYFPEIYWGRNGNSQWQAYPAEVVVKGKHPPQCLQ